MSKFTGPLKIEFTDEGGRSARLLEELIWEVGSEGSGMKITVPIGFVCDGASVPRLLWWLMPAWGDKGTRAAILHDYYLSLVEREPGPDYRMQRAFADQQFYEALIALGVPKWRARLCYLGVRAWSTYHGWIGVVIEQHLG